MRKSPLFWKLGSARARAPFGGLKKAVGGARARARTQSFFVGECDRFALCFGFRNFPTERFVVNGLQLRELATWRADSQAIRARQQTMVIFYIQTK